MQIDGLQAGLERKGLGWIGFCHNDIQYGNMLLHTASCDLVDTRIDAADPLAACLSLAEQNCSAPMTGTESGALPSEPTTSKVGGHFKSRTALHHSVPWTCRIMAMIREASTTMDWQ